MYGKTLGDKDEFSFRCCCGDTTYSKILLNSCSRMFFVTKWCTNWISVASYQTTNIFLEFKLFLHLFIFDTGP